MPHNEMLFQLRQCGCLKLESPKLSQNLFDVCATVALQEEKQCPLICSRRKWSMTLTHVTARIPVLL